MTRLAQKGSLGGYEDGVRGANSLEELEEVSGQKMGQAQISRLLITAENRPELLLISSERTVKRDLNVLPGESWSYTRHAKDLFLPAAGNHKALRKCIILLAHSLDLARTEKPERVYAFLVQAYKAAQAAALHPQKEWSYGWVLTGLEEEAVSRPRYSAQEHVALAAYHRDQQIIDKALGGGGGSSSGNGGGGNHSEDHQVKSLRSEVERLKTELKKAKSGGGGGGGKGKDKDKEKDEE